MNLREIANRAKVSLATVSRTINRVPTVRPANARRVQRVIDEVGYYPNTHARALVSGRSRIFGEIARLAFRALLHSVEIPRNRTSREVYTIHTDLVIRGSTAIAPDRLRQTAVPQRERRQPGGKRTPRLGLQSVSRK